MRVFNTLTREVQELVVQAVQRVSMFVVAHLFVETQQPYAGGYHLPLGGVARGEFGRRPGKYTQGGSPCHSLPVKIAEFDSELTKRVELSVELLL